MRAVTIKVAKARLNELVEAAERGEQVVLMRGSKHVASITPISADELELPPRLTDPQAERLWASLAKELEEGRSKVFPSAKAAVAYLRRRRVAPRPRRKA